ncbi:protein of unknown function [Alcaligenes faecalis subsp. faecalis]|nr:protein of unknown function [Alcaligenes faecalis subsp. faecalis]
MFVPSVGTVGGDRSWSGSDADFRIEVMSDADLFYACVKHHGAALFSCFNPFVPAV